MATFTPISKTRLHRWEAPPVEELEEGEAYELLIGGGFKLDIGDGYNLTIQPAVTGIVYTNVQKTVNHNWPQPTDQTTNYLNIGDGHNLLIGDGYKLLLGSGRSDTPWTERPRRNFKW